MMIVNRDLPVGSGKAVYSKNDLSSKEITPATIPPVIHFTTNSSPLKSRNIGLGRQTLFRHGLSGCTGFPFRRPSRSQGIIQLSHHHAHSKDIRKNYTIVRSCNQEK